MTNFYYYIWSNKVRLKKKTTGGQRISLMSSSRKKSLEGLTITMADMMLGYSEEAKVEIIKRIMRPWGCSPIGPMAWMALRTYDLIIETREGMIPNRNNMDIGDQWFKRLQLELHAAVGAKGSKIDLQEVILDGKPMSISVDAKTKRASRKAHRVFARGLFDNLIRPYSKSNWHLWLCPVGPYIVDECARDSMLNLPYMVCWADVVYLFHCSNYYERFCGVYSTIIQFMRAGVNILIDTDDYWLTYMRYVHVFSSLYIHIQVLEKHNSRIGGNWQAIIDDLRDLQKILHKEWEMDPVEIGMLAEQFSVENIRELNSCGKGLGQVFKRNSGNGVALM